MNLLVLIIISIVLNAPFQISFHYVQSRIPYSPPELGTRYLKSSGAAAIWQKKQQRCRLSLLKSKSSGVAAAATCIQNNGRCHYFRKISSKNNKKRWHSNTVPKGEISTLFTKVAIRAFKVLVEVKIGVSWLKW